MTFAKALDEPVLAELYDYWSQQRKGRIAPARGDIDPVDIPTLLPHIALTEIVPAADGKARFRYRLAGTEIEHHIGCPLAGRYIDELMRGDYLAFITGLYHRVIAEKASVYSENCYLADEADQLHVKRLMLPLSDDGESVTMVLAGLVFSPGRACRRVTIVEAQDRFRTLAVDVG